MTSRGTPSREAQQERFYADVAAAAEGSAAGDGDTLSVALGAALLGSPRSGAAAIVVETPRHGNVAVGGLPAFLFSDASARVLEAGLLSVLWHRLRGSAEACGAGVSPLPEAVASSLRNGSGWSADADALLSDLAVGGLSGPALARDVTSLFLHYASQVAPGAANAAAAANIDSRNASLGAGPSSVYVSSWAWRRLLVDAGLILSSTERGGGSALGSPRSSAVAAASSSAERTSELIFLQCTRGEAARAGILSTVGEFKGLTHDTFAWALACVALWRAPPAVRPGGVTAPDDETGVSAILSNLCALLHGAQRLHVGPHRAASVGGSDAGSVLLDADVVALFTNAESMLRSVFLHYAHAPETVPSPHCEGPTLPLASLMRLLADAAICPGQASRSLVYSAFRIASPSGAALNFSAFVEVCGRIGDAAFVGEAPPHTTPRYLQGGSTMGVGGIHHGTTASRVGELLARLSNMHSFTRIDVAERGRGAGRRSATAAQLLSASSSTASSSSSIGGGVVLGTSRTLPRLSAANAATGEGGDASLFAPSVSLPSLQQGGATASLTDVVRIARLRSSRSMGPLETVAAVGATTGEAASSSTVVSPPRRFSPVRDDGLEALLLLQSSQPPPPARTSASSSTAPSVLKVPSPSFTRVSSKVPSLSPVPEGSSPLEAEGSEAFPTSVATSTSPRFMGAQSTLPTLPRSANTSRATSPIATGGSSATRSPPLPSAVPSPTWGPLDTAARMPGSGAAAEGEEEDVVPQPPQPVRAASSPSSSQGNTPRRISRPLSASSASLRMGGVGGGIPIAGDTMAWPHGIAPLRAIAHPLPDPHAVARGDQLPSPPRASLSLRAVDLGYVQANSDAARAAQVARPSSAASQQRYELQQTWGDSSEVDSGERARQHQQALSQDESLQLCYPDSLAGAAVRDNLYGVPVPIPVPSMGKAAAARVLGATSLGSAKLLAPPPASVPGDGGAARRARSVSAGPNAATARTGGSSQARDGFDTSQRTSSGFYVDPCLVTALASHFAPLLPRIKPVFLLYCRLNDPSNAGILSPSNFMSFLRDIDALDGRVTPHLVGLQLALMARDSAVAAGSASASTAASAAAAPVPGKPRSGVDGAARRLAAAVAATLGGTQCSLGVPSFSRATSNVTSAGGNEATALGGGGGGACRAGLSLDDFLEAIVRVSELIRKAQRAAAGFGSPRVLAASSLMNSQCVSGSPRSAATTTLGVSSSPRTHRSASATSRGSNSGGGGGGGGGASLLSPGGGLNLAWSSVGGSMTGSASVEPSSDGADNVKRQPSGGADTIFSTELAAATSLCASFISRRVMPLLAVAGAESAAGSLAGSADVLAALTPHSAFLRRIFAWYVINSPTDFGSASTRTQAAKSAGGGVPSVGGSHSRLTHLPGATFGTGDSTGSKAPACSASAGIGPGGAGDHRLSAAAFAKMARDFELVPTLLSKLDVEAAFYASARRAGTAGAAGDDAIAAEATHSAAAGIAAGGASGALRELAVSIAPAFLREGPFIEALVRCSLVGFNAPCLAKELLSPSAKVLALIAWMASARAMATLESHDHTRGRTRSGVRLFPPYSAAAQIAKGAVPPSTDLMPQGVITADVLGSISRSLTTATLLGGAPAAGAAALAVDATLASSRGITIDDVVNTGVTTSTLAPISPRMFDRLLLSQSESGYVGRVGARSWRGQYGSLPSDLLPPSDTTRSGRDGGGGGDDDGSSSLGALSNLVSQAQAATANPAAYIAEALPRLTGGASTTRIGGHAQLQSLSGAGSQAPHTHLDAAASSAVTAFATVSDVAALASMNAAAARAAVASPPIFASLRAAAAASRTGKAPSAEEYTEAHRAEALHMIAAELSAVSPTGGRGSGGEADRAREREVRGRLAAALRASSPPPVAVVAAVAAAAAAAAAGDRRVGESASAAAPSSTRFSGMRARVSDVAKVAAAAAVMPSSSLQHASPPPRQHSQFAVEEDVPVAVPQSWGIVVADLEGNGAALDPDAAYHKGEVAFYRRSAVARGTRAHAALEKGLRNNLHSTREALLRRLATSHGAADAPATTTSMGGSAIELEPEALGAAASSGGGESRVLSRSGGGGGGSSTANAAMKRSEARVSRFAERAARLASGGPSQQQQNLWQPSAATTAAPSLSQTVGRALWESVLAGAAAERNSASFAAASAAGAGLGVASAEESLSLQDLAAAPLAIPPVSPAHSPGAARRATPAVGAAAVPQAGALRGDVTRTFFATLRGPQHTSTRAGDSSTLGLFRGNTGGSVMPHVDTSHQLDTGVVDHGDGFALPTAGSLLQSTALERRKGGVASRSPSRMTAGGDGSPGFMDGTSVSRARALRRRSRSEGVSSGAPSLSTAAKAAARETQRALEGGLTIATASHHHTVVAASSVTSDRGHKSVREREGAGAAAVAAVLAPTVSAPSSAPASQAPRFQRRAETRGALFSLLHPGWGEGEGGAHAPAEKVSLSQSRASVSQPVVGGDDAASFELYRALARSYFEQGGAVVPPVVAAPPPAPQGNSHSPIEAARYVRRDNIGGLSSPGYEME